MLKNFRWLIIPAFAVTMVGSNAFSATVNAKSPTASALASTVPAGSVYNALAPSRLLDTRSSGQTLGPGGSLNLTVTGGSVPSDATAVVLNVTVTGTSSAGDLTVYPTGKAQPASSNLNWVAGETVPNLVIVPVGTNGQVTFYNALGRTNVVVDLEGYFAPGPTDTAAGEVVIQNSATCSGAVYAPCGTQVYCPSRAPYVVSEGYDALTPLVGAGFSIYANYPVAAGGYLDVSPPTGWGLYGFQTVASSDWVLTVYTVCSP